jgi:peptide/nickel transport system ATP-binding protein
MGGAIPKGEQLLSVRNLHVTFQVEGTVIRAVDDLSFALGHREILGIVGESGSGKSVTSLALLRLVRPPGRISQGSIRFAGHDLLRLDAAAMHDVRGRGISMISQDPITSLNPVMTVGDQLARVIHLHVEPDAGKARQLALEALNQVEIPAAARRLGQYPHELSGGMCQRVMIAMAMAPRPKLLIADEPTTALDVTIQSQILSLLLRMREEHSVSIIFISHDIAVISQIADTVLVMYAGRAMEEGPVDEVLRSPQHPYTRMLLAAMPRLGVSSLRDRVPVIPGQVPSLASHVRGCIFAPRCPYAFDRCRERPPLLAASSERSAACWLVEANRPPAAVGALQLGRTS